MEQVFKGLKVVEFGAYAAGPVVGKHLADFGADVVHVESVSRPDGFRMQYPPYTDNKPGVNRSGCFAICNNNKYGITLNLKASGALDVAREMIAWADIVIENFTPGTMNRLGLGYETLMEIKPDIIMLSTCNQGQTGPHAHHPGFGSQLTSLTGFTNLTGFPDGMPSILYGPYIDFIGVGYGVIAVVAALDYRRRTGKGQYIDLAQYENGLQFLAPTLLDYVVNERVAERMGNHCQHAAPHGVYPCKGDDRWCALSVFSDEEWIRFCKCVDRPEWATDPRFVTLGARKENEDEIDRLITEWTSIFTAEQIMERLQSAGLRAGVVNTSRDLYTDPQMVHRGIWWKQTHPEMGDFHYEGPPFILSNTPAQPKMPSPCLGEHNYQFFVEMLGIDEEKFNQLIENGVIG